MNNTILKTTVRVECTPSDMLVHLALAREFSGRIYATGNPQNCFELGSGQSEMTLRIPLSSQCGTVQQVGFFTFTFLVLQTFREKKRPNINFFKKYLTEN